MPPPAIDLTIAVLTYNGEALLPDCLASIWAQDIPCEWELLVVDDHSARLPTILLPHRLVVHGSNLGNIAGTNTCFREAHGAWVLFVANDVRLNKDCLLHLWAHRGAHDITQPVLYQPDGEVDNMGIRWWWPGYGDRVRKVGQRVDAFANTCVLMRRSTWLSVGGFEEGLGISHEDVDFSLRAIRKGYTIGYCRLATAMHLMGQTIGKVVRTPLSPYYRRARRLTIERNYEGLNRRLRLWTTGLVDGLAASRRPRGPHAPTTPASAPPPPCS